MTTFTKTPPTEPGLYYWRIGKDDKKIRCREVWQGPGELLVDPGIELDVFGGEWGGRVPAPGTTWTVEEINDYLEDHLNLNAKEIRNQNLEYAIRVLDDPQDGIAATTARHRKDQG